jgi:aminocarboxymuconate-semialdehyde decarboxylase
VIADIHIHFVPQPFLAFVQRTKQVEVRPEAVTGGMVPVHIGPLSYRLPLTFFEIERLKQRLSEMRIERAILSLATPFVTYATSAAVACDAAELFNNEISAICRLAPDQFGAWAYLPLQDPQAAARELRRAVSELGLVGGYLSSNVNGRYLDVEELTPLFATAAELNAPLFVHPTNPPGRERMTKYELAVVAGYLFDTTLNIFHMIFGGLFDKFPDIRLCCAHLGGYAPLLHARMQRELDTNQALAESLTRPLRDYFRKLYFDTVCFDAHYARSMVEAEVVDPNHLVLGSDTPFPLGEPDPVRFIERSFETHGADSVYRILHRNWRTFLNGPKDGQ